MREACEARWGVPKTAHLRGHRQFRVVLVNDAPEGQQQLLAEAAKIARGHGRGVHLQETLGIRV